MTTYGPHLERLDIVAASVNGRRFAIGGHRDADGVARSHVHVFKVAKLAAQFSIDVGAPVTALTFLADDVLIVAIDGKLIVGDVSGDAAKSLAVVPIPARCTALATDKSGRAVVGAFEDGSVRRFEWDGKLRTRGEAAWAGRALRAVAFDDRTQTIAAGGDDGIVFTAVDLDQPPRKMPCGEGGVTSLLFTGDGRIAAGCVDGSIRLCFLDGAVDEEDRSGDNAHTGAVTALIRGDDTVDDAGQPRARRIHAASTDGVFTSWFVDGRRKPKRLELGAGSLTAAAWIPPTKKANADRDGGLAVVVTRNRRIGVVGLAANGGPSTEIRWIESRLEQLDGELSARSTKVRVAAVDALAAIAEDEARLLLDRALLSDGATEVKTMAATAIGSSARRRSRPALRAALNDGQAAVRAAALDALTTIETDRPLAAARAALESRHADLRIVALGRLPSLREASPLVPGLVAGSLSDADRDVRRAALDNLEKLEAPTSIGPAQIALERGPADVRTEALRRITKRPLSSEADLLLQAALDDVDEDVRRTAFFAGIAVRPRLRVAILDVDPSAKKHFENLGGAGAKDTEPLRLSDLDALQPLFAAMACPSPDTALRGARVLAALGDIRAVGALLQLSRESDTGVRRGTVDALLILALAIPHDDRASARLAWLLDDADDNISQAAYDALLKLAEPEGAEGRLRHAALALTTKRPDVRQRALQIVVEHPGSALAEQLLSQVLDDESDTVRAEALRTLLLWHKKVPEVALKRAAASRHQDIRKKVVHELERLKDDWAQSVLLSLVADSAEQVGLAALQALTKDKKAPPRADVYLMAMHSPRPTVRAEGCKKCHRAPADDLRARLLELVQDEHPIVHLAAIDAADKLLPKDPEPFRRAFVSIFYELRVRAAELLGHRRDRAAVDPMKVLLRIPSFAFDRPSDELRQRGARAIADVGDPAAIPFLVTLLDDPDGIVREMGARGLATACRPGREKPLLDALAHADLAVRSWAAEGLARLGDTRAIGVLAGTLEHEHRPIRIGAILGHVALGADGVRGLLAGLEDTDREIQDITFAIVLARDIALARVGLEPDLLLSALSSTHPEIRFGAARAIEERTDAPAMTDIARQLVGPKRPDRAGDMKRWPSDEDQTRLLDVVVRALASDHPEQRYAAARVLELRAQPEAFWREARRLAQPGGGTRPHTNFDTEQHTPRKKDWVRRLFDRTTSPPSASRTERVLKILDFAGAKPPRTVPAERDIETSDDLVSVVFGVYAGLVRQAPPAGDADETHRVRRDSLDRLAVLAPHPAIGVQAALPIFMRGLSDPHHLVRRQAAAALTSVYPTGSLEPFVRQLDSTAADVGRAAVDVVLERAMAGDQQAKDLAITTLNAKNRDVRKHALTRLPRLFEKGSVEPWLIALECPFADVRLAVVDRLDTLRATATADEDTSRVDIALAKALESDHEDLRMKAALSLASRGDVRTIDVLASFLRSEDQSVARRAASALETLATDGAAEVIVLRIEDDADKTADQVALVKTLGRIGRPASAPLLEARLSSDDDGDRRHAWSALVAIARDRDTAPVKLPDGGTRTRYHEDRALRYAAAAAKTTDPALRIQSAQLLRDVDDRGAEDILTRLTEDRDTDVRIAATEALAFRAEHVANATLAPLESVLRGERRELVLPAALGMAGRSEAAAFRPLMLVFKAGTAEERERAILGLGTLGDTRALDELLALVDPSAELDDETKTFIPAVAEALGAMLPKIVDTERQQVARDTLKRMVVEGDDAVRLRTLVGLRRAGDPTSRHTIETIARDRHDNVAIRRHAIAQLARLADEASEPLLAEALGDGDRQLRQLALDALRTLFPNDPTRVSLHGLDAPYADISGPAAAFLAEHGDPVTLLERLGAKKRSAATQEMLRRGLARRGVCPSREVIRLLESPEPGLRAEAAWLAGTCGTPDLGGAVLGAIVRSMDAWQKNPTPELEAAWLAALWAADRLGADATGPARSALDHADAPSAVRATAARYLERRGTTADLKRLGDALFDRSATVRAAAARSLGALDADGAADRMVPSLDIATARPVVEAAHVHRSEALLRSDETRRVVMPTVLETSRVELLAQVATNRGDAAPRLSAIAALGRTATDDARAALAKILEVDSEADEIRAAAFRAIRRAERHDARQKRYES